MNQLHLHRVKETLGNPVVPSIALPTHAADELVLAQDRLEVASSILAASVRMTNQPLLRIASQNRPHHGLGDQRIRDGPL